MDTIGAIKCGIVFTYVTNAPVINLKELLATSFSDLIKKELQFSECRHEDKEKQVTLFFENGRVESGGESYAIDKLGIGNAGLSVVVNGPTSISRQIADRVLTLIDSHMPHLKLTERRKRESCFTTMKVKLNIDPIALQNPLFVSTMDKYKSRMKMTDFSEVQMNFPTAQAYFVSEPDIRGILSKVDNDETRAEIESGAGMKKLSIKCDSAEEYRNRVFDVTMDADLDTTKAMLGEIEATFGKKKGR